MGYLLYEDMLPAQADDALDEFIAERGPALRLLREVLSGHGLDPDEVLDGSPESVALLWEWITARVEALGVDPRPLDEDPTRDTWPSWARHGLLVDAHPRAPTLILVDGFTTYLAEVIVAEVPGAQWLVGEHRIGSYPMLNCPVLAAADHQIFLPGIPLYSTYQTVHGHEPMGGAEMYAHLLRTITALRGEGPVAEVDCFDVGLRPDLPTDHPDLLASLVAELAGRDGVVSVHRYGPDALVIDAPDWDETRLKLWLTLWLERALLR